MPDVLSLMDRWGPEKVVTVSHARSGMKGVLVIDNTARGMGKGGTRMSPNVTTDEIARLARVMTWKWAANDLFYGGAKAGIVADPTAPDKERVVRAFARALYNEVPSEYVFGLDMGLTEDDAAIIQDELGDRGAAVGTHHELGGVPYDRLGITGFGVAEVADAVMRRIDLPVPGARVVVQGLGAVGSAAVRRFAELGCTVVAVSSLHGALYDPDGIDVERLLRLHAEAGDAAVKEYGGGTILALGDELLVPTELLVPAAFQDVIDDDVAGRITAKVLVEGANLPTSPKAQQVLADRGIVVTPDFIANAGGVIAAGYAMDARYSAFRPDADHIRESVSTKLRANAILVHEESTRRDVTSHEAALALARTRVHAAMRLKGRIPE